MSPNIKYGRLEEYSEVVVATVIPKDGVRQNAPHSNDLSILASNSKEQLIETKILNCRYIDQKYFDSVNRCFDFHPYVVFANKESLPKWAWDVISSNRRAAWRLSMFQEDARSTVVSISFSDSIPQNNVFKPIIISDLLKKHIGLDHGQKITLELLTSDKVREISGVLLTSSSDVSRLLFIIISPSSPNFK